MKVCPDEAERLVETYSDLILRLSLSWVRSSHDAQDICQTVLLKRLEYTGTFPAPEAERAWIVRVTINTCKNLRRSFWRRNVVGMECVADPVAPEPEPGGLLEELRHLPDRDREVLLLRYYMGYDAQEIAALLGIGTDAVRMRLSRARRRLKQKLEEDGYEPSAQ